MNDWSDRPTIREVEQARRWRYRFAIFICMVAFAVLCGVLVGGLTR